MRFSINFLKTDADIEDESLLSSPLFFVMIACFSHVKREQLSKQEERLLLKWLYIANAKGRYSRGSSETLMDADLATIRRGGSPENLLETGRQQFGRLAFEPIDFVSREAGSSLFSLVFLYHHIFPKSKLKKEYETREINEVANMAFVSGRTNRNISNREPVEYLPSVVASRGEETLTLQAIPTDRELWKTTNYRGFLVERRRALAET